MATTHHILQWPCSLERLVNLLIHDPLADPGIVKAMKDVKDCVVLSGDWVDGKRKVDLSLTLDPPVPVALRNLLPKEKLGWVQRGLWDPKKGLYTVKIEPHTLKNLLKISMRSHLYEKEDGTATQDMYLYAECEIPVLGSILEKFALTKIWESLKDQFDEEAPGLEAEHRAR